MSQPSSSSSSSSISNTKLIFILSPAKTLDLSEKYTTQEDEKLLPIPSTIPLKKCHLKTNLVASAMKEHASAGDGDFTKFCKLLGISSNLGQTAKEYWIQFELDKNKNKNTSTSSSSSSFPCKPCGFAFSGAAYQGLQLSTLASASSSATSSSSSSSASSSSSVTATATAVTFQYLQDHLRIIDPLYGWLRPMDVIQPYRLEMATKKLFNGITTTMTNTNDSDDIEDDQPLLPSISLQDFWRPTLHKCLQDELTTDIKNNNNNSKKKKTDNDPSITTSSSSLLVAQQPRLIILNLASDEYSSAILPIPSFLTSNNTTIHVVKIIFQQEGRVISVHAKRARGLMVRYLAEHRIEQLDEVKEFNMEGYTYQEPVLSSNDDEDNDNDNVKLPTTLTFTRVKNWKTSATTTTNTSNKKKSSSTMESKKEPSPPQQQQKQQQQQRKKRQRRGTLN